MVSMANCKEESNLVSLYCGSFLNSTKICLAIWIISWVSHLIYQVHRNHSLRDGDLFSTVEILNDKREERDAALNVIDEVGFGGLQFPVAAAAHVHQAMAQEEDDGDGDSRPRSSQSSVHDIFIDIENVAPELHGTFYQIVGQLGLQPNVRIDHD